jgi:hypothetical protein
LVLDINATFPDLAFRNYAFSFFANMPISDPPAPLDDPSVSHPLECPPLRWGLIGCGRISHDFTQALKLLPTAKVQACAARSLDSAKAFADKHGIEKSCKFMRTPSSTYILNH